MKHGPLTPQRCFKKYIFVYRLLAKSGVYGCLLLPIFRYIGEYRLKPTFNHEAIPQDASTIELSK